jgi:hypothetical protein
MAGGYRFANALAGQRVLRASIVVVCAMCGEDVWEVGLRRGYFVANVTVAGTTSVLANCYNTQLVALPLLTDFPGSDQLFSQAQQRCSIILLFVRATSAYLWCYVIANGFLPTRTHITPSSHLRLSSKMHLQLPNMQVYSSKSSWGNAHHSTPIPLPLPLAMLTYIWSSMNAGSREFPSN